MAVIPSIIADFRAKLTFSRRREVDLFRDLAQAIAKHSHSIFIDETHGAKVCNVSFTSVTGKPETCEIADLLIISCVAVGTLRATFWQAKKQVISKWVSASTGNEQFDFQGKFNQWDLLSRRPAITGSGSFLPPGDLLSSFASASIESFGVFYERSSSIEVNHSVAEFVACQNPTALHPKMFINGYLAQYYYGMGEAIVRPTLEAFLESLFANQIGALLDPAQKSHCWLVRYARSKGSKTPGGNVGLDALNHFLQNSPPIGDAQNGSEDGLSVLIVGEQKQE